MPGARVAERPHCGMRVMRPDGGAQGQDGARSSVT
jgi:hypothetical protein